MLGEKERKTFVLAFLTIFSNMDVAIWRNVSGKWTWMKWRELESWRHGFNYLELFCSRVCIAIPIPIPIPIPTQIQIQIWSALSGIGRPTPSFDPLQIEWVSVSWVRILMNGMRYIYECIDKVRLRIMCTWIWRKLDGYFASLSVALKKGTETVSS